MKLYFYVTERISKSESCHRKHIKYKWNHQLFLLIRVLVWELMSNWLTWKFGQKKASHYVLHYLYTEVVEYAAGHLSYLLLVDSMPGKYRKAFVFNCNFGIWMNMFCLSVCCIYVQLKRQYCDTQGIVIIQIIWYMPQISHICLQRRQL